MLRLKDARERHDPPFTQEGLAYAAGVSLGTIRRAERLGQANSTTLQKIAEALGISVGDLFEGAA